MSEEHFKTVLSGAKRFFTGTIFSRVTGMLREMLMTAIFGGTPAVAAFMLAFRFSNLLRRLLGEGAVNSAFVPSYEHLRKHDEKRALYFYRDLVVFLGALLALIVVTLEAVLLAFLLWGNVSPDNKEILLYTALMFPGLIFICLYAVNSSLLQCNDSYFLPAIAPAIFNVVWIVAIILLRKKPSDSAMLYLSLSITVAYLFQFLMTLPKVLTILGNHIQGKLKQEWRFFSKELLIMAKALSLSVIGVAATQINSFLDGLFARGANILGPIYLSLSIRVEQLPLSLFGIALVGSFLPIFSRVIKRGAEEEARSLLLITLKKAWILIIPCNIGLLLLGASGLNLLFGRGNFSVDATRETILCLWAYGLGLFPMMLVILLSSVCYAWNNYFIPTISTIASIGCNALLNVCFVFLFHWGAVSIALATTISAFLNLFILTRYLGASKNIYLSKQDQLFILKILALSLLAASITVIIGRLFLQDYLFLTSWKKEALYLPRNLYQQLFTFGLESCSFGAALILLAKISRFTEFNAFLKQILRIK